MELIAAGFGVMLSTAADILPVVLFVLAFQVIVVRRRIANVTRLAAGIAVTVAGLGLFLVGLEEALFPLGRLMAEQLTHPAVLAGGPGDWTSYYWVYIFALTIGFATTIAEPALLAVAMKASDTSGGAISVWGLRVAVAVGVAVGVCLGCFRIVTGLPLQLFILVGYVVVILQTVWAPRLIVPLAYDSGGVTTSTVTVPLVAALGLGLAESVPGRSALLDGFGLVAFASLFPIISVLAYAQITVYLERRRRARAKAMPSISDSLEES